MSINARYQAHFQEVLEDIADNAEHIPTQAPATAGIRYYLDSINVTNMHATQATRVNIKDGAGGTIIDAFPAGANGGGAIKTYPADSPLEFTKGNAIVVECETAGALVTVAVKGFKRAERS